MGQCQVPKGIKQSGYSGDTPSSVEQNLSKQSNPLNLSNFGHSNESEHWFCRANKA